ncbi:MAG: 4Fe-4S binding protein [Hadesarchaea archaeon]|nr:4Fe-4S binding protein [Hadesarchaea archaeon]
MPRRGLIPVSAKPSVGSSGKTSSWRTQRPEVDRNKCTRCRICWIFCPDVAISFTEEGPEINHDYCKGCGICAMECPVKAIRMEAI